MKKILCVLFGCFLLNACSGLFDRDNTPLPSPLVKFKPEIKTYEQWGKHATNGTGNNYLKLTPALNAHFIFTASHDGSVVALNKTNGKRIWRAKTGVTITSGVGANSNLVVVGSNKGQVVALSQQTGAKLWTTRVSSEVLATPAATDSLILVKANDGHLFGLAPSTGQILWRYQQIEPSFILRGSSDPLIHNNSAFVGFADGRLAKLTAQEGSLIWQQEIAFPKGSFAIERMVDIDANPVVFDNKVYGATYQGKIASLDYMTGRILWVHDISSYTGIAVNKNAVYVSDANSHIWAFDANDGSILWQQNQLQSRNISGPALIGNYLVVGDGQGYLHWFNTENGHLAARTHVSRSGILAAPQVENGVLYVLTQNGYLAAYTTQL